MDRFNEFCTKWFQETSDITDIYTNLNIPVTSSLEEVNTLFDSLNDQVYDIYHTMMKEELIGSITPIQIENKIKINKLFANLHYAKNTLNAFYHTSKICNTNSDLNPSDDHTMFAFQNLDFDEMKPNQKLILYVMNYLKDQKYKRYNDFCYKMIQTNDGYDTFAWEKVDTIQNVIYKVLSKRSNMNMFLISTSTRDAHKFVTDFVSKMDDSSFPVLKKDRHIFSFKNGIYFAKFWDEIKESWTDKFFLYGDTNIPSNITSCKFFDVELENPFETDPFKIKTPLLDKILCYQNLPDDVITWNKVYLGRLLYENNELDNWQTIMFYLGQGGTGKSTINNDIAKQFYDPQDVAIMSNNIQKKFGLSDIYDKFLFIAPEIKKDWCIEQAEFQGIVSGDVININIKYKQSESKLWTTPGLLGGNENPDFIDNSGSVKRRIVITRFDKKVKRGDSMLGKKLQKELPSIIKQCNMLYQLHVDMVGNDIIWDHLPPYFKETQSRMADATNSMSNFLNSGTLVFHEDKYIPKDVFVEYYNKHCRDNNLKAFKTTTDFLNSYFESCDEYDLVCKRDTLDYQGAKLNKFFIIGVDIFDDNDGEDEPHNQC